jgi:Methyltransferase domain
VDPLPPDELVRQTYRLALRREPEPEVLAELVRRLDEGTLSPASLLRDVVTSDEFTRLQALDDAVAFATSARGANERPRELEAPPQSDERPIEIAWCLARYRGEPRVLDAGYAFAAPTYLAALASLPATELVGVDLAEADVSGLRSVQADLRRLPFEQHSFDVVFCISTIEHVGADNSRYGFAAEEGELDEALHELRRVGGRILITVPCGEREDHGWFVQDEPDAWRRRFRDAGFLVFEDEVYELTDEGWRSAPDFDPGGVHFGEHRASAVLCAELHPRTLANVARETVRRLRS